MKGRTSTFHRWMALFLSLVMCMSLLPAGTVSWRDGTKEQTLSIPGGICEIRDNVITILLEGSTEKGEDHANPAGER